MDFNLTKEQELIRKALAEFTEEEVKPIAAETDRTEQYRQAVPLRRNGHVRTEGVRRTWR